MAVFLKPSTVRGTLDSNVFASVAMCKSGAGCMRRVPRRRGGRGFPAGSANVMAYGASVAPCALRTSPLAGGAAAGGLDSLLPSKLGRCHAIRVATIGLGVPQSKRDVRADCNSSTSSGDTTSPSRIAWPSDESASWRDCWSPIASPSSRSLARSRQRTQRFSRGMLRPQGSDRRHGRLSSQEE